MMDEVLTSTLCRALHDRLNYLDTLATEGDLRSRAALSSTEITRLTAGWRTLLLTHQPNDKGRCPQCSGWLRPRRHPCTVWTTAHQHLLTADDQPPASTGRHGPAAGRRTVAALGAS